MSFCQYLPTNRPKAVIPGIPKVAPTTKNTFIKDVAPSAKSTSHVSDARKGNTSSSSRGKRGGGTASTTLHHSGGAPSTRKRTTFTRGSSSSLVKVSAQALGYDILHIDAHIKEMLKGKVAALPALQKDLNALLWIMNNSDDALDRIQAKTESSILRKRIQDIEYSFEFGFYLLRTTDLLNEYKDLFEKTKQRTFVSVSAETSVNERLIAKKNLLISKYLRVAREYVQLEDFVVKSGRLVCEACSGTDFEQGEDEAIYTCKQCGNTLELLDDSPTYKDTDRVNMASRYQYTCRGHFIEAMNKFEGKQNTTIPVGVKNLLEREMKNHNLTPATTSKDHIYMFLSEKKLSNHYEDINLIYFMITNTPSPNITDYRPQLLELFDLQEEAYAEVKDPERTNSLNVNYKLYKLLQLVGYPCKKDDFYILRTRTKLEEHDEKWREIIAILKKKHPDQQVWRFIGTL